MNWLIIFAPAIILGVVFAVGVIITVVQNDLDAIEEHGRILRENKRLRAEIMREIVFRNTNR